MVSYAQAVLPRWHGRDGSDLASLTSEIADWSMSTAMRDLVECFDEKWPSGDVVEVLAGLEEISARCWDFRAGGERAAAVARDFSRGVTERVHAAAAALGLRHHNLPRERAYDHVLIHGGLLRGCLIRAGHAAALLDGVIDSPEVCGLGSFRPTTEPEQSMASELAVGECGDEFDAMDIALRSAFPGAVRDRETGEKSPDKPHVSFLTREYRIPIGPRLRVLAAPSSDPNRRANTADTCTFWANSVGRPDPGQKILLVTTEHFVPFQHADAIRVLGVPYGCAVETVGVDPATVSSGHLRQRLTTTNFLQETRSAIRSMQLLLSTVHTG
ncbi:hypothetical protein [Micromonospora sp. NBRC 101691]|uniref:hypothetical protein n=1 Tax=Micromonospora sp. NBRC 101691 TaxID=3032198 RepID=UPI0024A55E48|nr:hypothetical protein [Micromonospora sp. NBRC 101691]GLY24534.1 hypothetical protein Misp04_42660 [Micromonospora sp. NBRC 101691]